MSVGDLRDGLVGWEGGGVVLRREGIGEGIERIGMMGIMGMDE